MERFDWRSCLPDFSSLESLVAMCPFFSGESIVDVSFSSGVAPFEAFNLAASWAMIDPESSVF